MPEKDAKDYADSIHAIFVETSAKNAININEVFIEISECISPVFDGPHICAPVVGVIEVLYVWFFYVYQGWKLSVTTAGRFFPKDLNFTMKKV